MENPKNISIHEQIKKEYVRYALTHQELISIFNFCEKIEISEDDFYANFNSFKSLENAIWKDFILKTIAILEEDETYQEYSAREKTLAFFYTFIEVLKANRSFVLMRLTHFDYKKLSFPSFLIDFNKEFNRYAKEIIKYAHTTGEIAPTPIISTQYSHVFNINCMYILKVWLNDESDNYQTTDAAIEKTINLLFELLHGGIIEGFVDLIKFAYQHKAY